MFWLLHFRKSPDDYNDTDCLSISPAGSTSSGESGKRTFQDSPPKFPDINDPSPPPMMGHTGKWARSTIRIPCYVVCFLTPHKVFRKFLKCSCQSESLIKINFLNSCNPAPRGYTYTLIFFRFRERQGNKNCFWFRLLHCAGGKI